MAKWTPGPWRVEKGADGGIKVMSGDGSFNVCRIDKAVTYVMDFDELAEPDANLIAAVHAMYEALEAAANTLISLHSDDEDFRYTGSEMDSSSWDDPEAFETFCQISAALASANPPAGKDDEDE